MEKTCGGSGARTPDPCRWGQDLQCGCCHRCAADRFAAVSDTIQFCFSKGLGAPVGSIVCGPADLISEIRYLRKRLGGGMRQAGVIAAAARVALAGRDRLTEDHALARELGDAIAERFPDALDPSWWRPTWSGSTRCLWHRMAGDEGTIGRCRHQGQCSARRWLADRHPPRRRLLDVERLLSILA